MEVSSVLIIRKMKETSNSNLVKTKVQKFANIELIYVTELSKKFINVNLIIRCLIIRNNRWRNYYKQT